MAIPIPAADVEAEAGMGVVVPMMGWIQSRTAEPVAASAVTYVGQPGGYGSQQYRIQSVTGAS